MSLEEFQRELLGRTICLSVGGGVSRGAEDELRDTCGVICRVTLLPARSPHYLVECRESDGTESAVGVFQGGILEELVREGRYSAADALGRGHSSYKLDVEL